VSSSDDAPVLRLAVAGLGGMGVVHAQNAANAAGAALVALASYRPGRAEAVARELGLRVRTGGYEEVLAAEDVDALVVAVRSIDHARVAEAALERGKHVLLEKPGATTLADHDRLARAAEARPELVVQVAYQRRFDAAFAHAHQLARSGAVGEPLLVVATSRDTDWPEGDDPRAAGGFLLDMAIHDYDVACWLLGQEPVEVYAARQAAVYPELEALGDLDNAVVTIRFDGGGLAVTHVSRTCAFGHDVRCELVGSEGSLLVGNSADGGPGVTVLTRGDAPRFPQDYRELFADAYRAELDAFVAACRGRSPRGPGLADDRRAVAVGIAARASAVGGSPLAVGRDWAWPER
jgi:myo-inositol 2-dehydrogenase / D-chiro-inositol 1-dehydrogenase